MQISENGAYLLTLACRQQVEDQIPISFGQSLDEQINRSARQHSARSVDPVYVSAQNIVKELRRSAGACSCGKDGTLAPGTMDIKIPADRRAALLDAGVQCIREIEFSAGRTHDLSIQELNDLLGR